jgi:hypothetical protein
VLVVGVASMLYVKKGAEITETSTLAPATETAPEAARGPGAPEVPAITAQGSAAMTDNVIGGDGYKAGLSDQPAQAELERARTAQEALKAEQSKRQQERQLKGALDRDSASDRWRNEAAADPAAKTPEPAKKPSPKNAGIEVTTEQAQPKELEEANLAQSNKPKKEEKTSDDSKLDAKAKDMGGDRFDENRGRANAPSGGGGAAAATPSPGVIGTGTGTSNVAGKKSGSAPGTATGTYAQPPPPALPPPADQRAEGRVAPTTVVTTIPSGATAAPAPAPAPTPAATAPRPQTKPAEKPAQPAKTMTTTKTPAKLSVTKPASTDKAEAAGPAPDAKRNTTALLAWAKDQHQRTIALVKKGDCTAAARTAVGVSNRAPDYYAQFMAGDRALKGCTAYINAERDRDAERSGKARAQKRVNVDEAPMNAK